MPKNDIDLIIQAAREEAARVMGDTKDSEGNPIERKPAKPGAGGWVQGISTKPTRLSGPK